LFESVAINACRPYRDPIDIAITITVIVRLATHGLTDYWRIMRRAISVPVKIQSNQESTIGTPPPRQMTVLAGSLHANPFTILCKEGGRSADKP
jgi:hypothetical protein